MVLAEDLGEIGLGRESRLGLGNLSALKMDLSSVKRLRRNFPRGLLMAKSTVLKTTRKANQKAPR